MSTEFPASNKSLGDAFAGAVDVLSAVRETGPYMDATASLGQVIDVITSAFGAVAAHLVNGDHAYPQTVCPIPTNDDMAAAMQLLGYDFLKRNAPDRLHQEIVGIPRADLCEVLGWLEGALKCKAWEWSPDQEAYATDALNRATLFLNGIDPDVKDPSAGISSDVQELPEAVRDDEAE